MLHLLVDLLFKNVYLYMNKIEKYKELIELNFDFGESVVRFITMNEILNCLDIEKNQCIAFGKSIQQLNIKSKHKRVDNKVYRVYNMQYKQDYSISNRFFENKKELMYLILIAFQKDEKQYLSNNQILNAIKEIRPTFNETKTFIGRILLELGFKQAQKRINGKNSRVFYLKRVEQHNQNLEDLF